MRRILLVVCALVALQMAEAGKKNGSKGRRCGTERCKAGQKCMTNNDGEKYCACRPYCPQKKFDVCGSDGRTYFNKCELHRIACVEGRKLKIAHDGACAKDNDVQSTKERKHPVQKLPLVCYEIERNELRQLLVDWIRRRVYKEKKTYREVVSEMFTECDKDSSKVLDADEMLRCTERGNQDVKDTDSHILRGLCVDALISIGSTRRNWVLTDAELQRLLDPDFIPPTKECQLEDRQYKDGAETEVDCNVCVCACGDWVCTGAPCGKEASRNPGVPGPVKNGVLPSMDQREIFLNGFRAADEVHVPAVQDEVATKRHHRDIAQELDSLDRKN